MKKILLIVSCALVLSACESNQPSPSPGTKEYESKDPGGVGMTYGGKLGVDLGNGIIMPFDGSGIGIGFSF